MDKVLGVTSWGGVLGRLRFAIQVGARWTKVYAVPHLLPVPADQRDTVDTSQLPAARATLWTQSGDGMTTPLAPYHAPRPDATFRDPGHYG